MPKAEDDNLFREYLLGALSEADATRIEEEYFRTEEAFERLCVAEDDLIDAYTLGELSESECSRFEQRFLLTKKQQGRARFARIMLRRTPMEREVVANIDMGAAAAPWLARQLAFLTLNPLFTASAAAAITLFLLGGWWLIGSRREAVTHQQTRETAAQPQQRATQSPAASPADVRQPDTQALPGARASRVVTLALVEGIVRDPGASNRLFIPSDASIVRLRVTTDVDDSEAYRETVRRVEGDLVLRPSVIGQERLGPGRAIVISEMKANLLRSGDYVLTLSANRRAGPPEIVAEYSFRVVRR